MPPPQVIHRAAVEAVLKNASDHLNRNKQSEKMYSLSTGRLVTISPDGRRVSRDHNFPVYSLASTVAWNDQLYGKTLKS